MFPGHFWTSKLTKILRASRTILDRSRVKIRKSTQNQKVVKQSSTNRQSPFCLHKRSLVYTQENLLCIHKRYTQEISGACTTLLCMLWAREPRGRGPKKAAVEGLGPAQLPFWVPGLVPGPWVSWPSAFTRVLCMHNTPCTSILCIHRNLDSITHAAK